MINCPNCDLKLDADYINGHCYCRKCYNEVGPGTGYLPQIVEGIICDKVNFEQSIKRKLGWHPNQGYTTLSISIKRKHPFLMKFFQYCNIFASITFDSYDVKDEVVKNLKIGDKITVKVRYNIITLKIISAKINGIYYMNMRP